jgi:hypothetical protein
MEDGKEEKDQSLLDSLSKKYQLFLDSPNGEINVYLVLSKNDKENKMETNTKPPLQPSMKNSSFQMSRDGENSLFMGGPISNGSRLVSNVLNAGTKQDGQL